MATLTVNPDEKLRGKVVLAPNGRIVIPAAIREELGVAPGDTLLLNVEDGVLQIESYATRIRRVQREVAEAFRGLRAPGASMADELIAERREEARREEEEWQRDAEAHRARTVAGEAVKALAGQGSSD
jgi:AbrB family looped-hinge helix DNA binding protein